MAGSITILGITIPVYLIARWIASPSVQSEIGRWFEKRTNALYDWWSERHNNLPRHGGEDENETRKENEMETTEVDKPAWGAGMFALLCILSLCPIIGLIVGLINVKHGARMRQARVLIIIAVIMLFVNAAILFAG